MPGRSSNKQCAYLMTIRLSVQSESRNPICWREQGILPQSLVLNRITWPKGRLYTADPLQCMFRARNVLVVPSSANCSFALISGLLSIPDCFFSFKLCRHCFYHLTECRSLAKFIFTINLKVPFIFTEPVSRPKKIEKRLALPKFTWIGNKRRIFLMINSDCNTKKLYRRYYSL